MVYLLTLFLLAADPVVLTGKVTKITDGDTIYVLDANKVEHKIRLSEIDAPEAKQAFGTRSKEALGEKVFGKDVRVEWSEKDRYGRILGKVFLGDRWINKEMVAKGWAWHFKRYSQSEELADAEESARGQKLGLWQDKDPIPPWEFRKKKTKQ